MVDRGGGGGGGYVRPWFHRSLGRMETERMLVDSTQEGAFLIRPSESMKGAYVLSLIYQKRIHHYRIIPNEDASLSVQAQQGVQRKRFVSLDELVAFYNQPKRGLVCALTMPLGGEQTDDDYDDPDEIDSDDDGDGDEEVEDSGDKQKNVLLRYLQAYISHIDFTKVDPNYVNKFKKYLDEDVVFDVLSMTSPTPQLTHLKQTFTPDVECIHRQLDKLMAQLDTMLHFMETLSPTRANASSPAYTSEPTYDNLCAKLDACSAAMKKLETSAFSTFKNVSASVTGASPNSLTQHTYSGTNSLSNEVQFDVVKTEQLGNKKNLCITVNVKDCRIIISKQGEFAGGTIYPASQIVQLIKSRSKEQKLGLLLEGQNRKDYTFTGMQAREHFCQLVQVMRSKLQGDVKDPDSISVFIGSWNMGNASPPNDINSWLKCEGLGRTLDKNIAAAHDIYAIGTQESGMNESAWIARLKSTLKALVKIDYEKIAVQTLWGIRLVILVKPEHMNKIAHVQHAQVRTGIGNTLGNKGAVGICFYFDNLSLGFISGHLTSGTEKCNRRNQNYHDILKGMVPLKHRHLSQFDLINQFNHLFFFGDLNYRVTLKPEDIVEMAKQGDYHSIYCSDQLRIEKDKKKIFVGFDESPIVFPPTYRFKKGERTMSSYVWVKHKRSGDRINEPSFCDRVLWRSYPGTRIVNTSYGCTQDIMTSDHSPLFSTFKIGGVKQYPAQTSSHIDTNTCIIISQCKAKILTSSKTCFYIEIHSACFQGIHKTKPNNSVGESDIGCIAPQWIVNGSEPVCSIPPIMTSHEYLMQQHILLLLKSTDSDEPYAECCIALGSVISPTPQQVDRELTHQGQSVGDFECFIHVTMSHYPSQNNNDKDIYGNFDFIRSDDDKQSHHDFKLSNNRTDPGSRPPVPIPSSLNDTRPPLPTPPDNWQPIHRSDSATTSSNIRSHQIPQQPFGSVPRSTIQTNGPPIVNPRRMPSSFNASTRPHHSQGALPPLPSTSPSSSSPSFPPVPSRRNNSGSTPSTRPAKPAKPVFKVTSTPSSSTRVNSAPVYDQLDMTNIERGGPPVPQRRSFVSGASVNTQRSSPTPHGQISELLRPHGLQHYASLLINSGYDDTRYLSQITESDLMHVGVVNHLDREKLRSIFRNLNH